MLTGGKLVFQCFCILSLNFCKCFASDQSFLGKTILLQDNTIVLRENAEFLSGTRYFCERTEMFNERSANVLQEIVIVL